MGMRITTGMMMNTYRFNLQNSTNNMSNTRDKVMSQRKFMTYAEDPASATQAWRIRRAMSNNYDYQSNNADTTSRFNIAWTTMGVVNHDLLDLTGRFSTIRGVSDGTASGRQPLGQVMRQTAETIIQALNGAKYGDHYVFSGRDEMNPPFTWNEDMTILYYRGVNVGAGAVERPIKPEWAYNDLDTDGFPIDMPDEDEMQNNPATTFEEKWSYAWARYYIDQAKSEKPDWVKAWEKDGWDTENPPEGMPDDEDDEWVKYYNDLKAWNEQEEPKVDEEPKMPESREGIPEPEEVPAWTKEDPAKLPDPHTEWDEAWEKYLDELKAEPKTAVKPTIDAWANDDPDDPIWGEKDEFGVPANAKAIFENEESTPYMRAWAEYYLDQGDVARLKMLSEEEQFVDLGMGLREESRSNLVYGTAFNRSLPGINMLGGYGVDEDGDPRNVVLLMRRMGELLSACDADSGDWASASDREEAMRLLDKINDAFNRTTEAYSYTDTQGQFLQSNQDVLETQGYYLQEERYNLEMLDPADAITEFMWAYNCYSAALKVGTQLLSQSLLDYMS